LSVSVAVATSSVVVDAMRERERSTHTKLFKEKKNFMQMADPLLEGNFPVKPLYQALAIAAMCIQESDSTRPIIKDVVIALHFLTMPNSNRPSEEVLENYIPENGLPPNSNRPSEEVPKNYIPENELPPEQQIEINDCVTTNDEDSPHSSKGDPSSHKQVLHPQSQNSGVN
jgi:hypothetical protein